MENFETFRLDQTGQQTQEILDQVSTNTADIAQLRALYEALTQSEPIIIQPSDTWPVADPQENVIYRVIDRVNTPPQSYSDYMWNGTAMVLMATYNNSIDNEPTPGSNSLVKSGGVAASIVFDISAYHATGSTLATYANLAAALGTDGANVPASVRKGGMSVKFVKSSDNKYVQYRLMADEWSTTEADWQGVDNEPTAGSDNLVKSGGVASEFGKIEGVLLIDSESYSGSSSHAFEFTEVSAETSAILQIQGNTSAIYYCVFYHNSENVGFVDLSDYTNAEITIPQSANKLTVFPRSGQSLDIDVTLRSLGQLDGIAEQINGMSEQIFPKVFAEYNGYIDADTGVPVSNVNWRYSDLFVVYKGLKITVFNRIDSSQIIIAYYDEDGNYLKNLSPKDSEAIASEYKVRNVVVPEGACFARYHSAYDNNTTSYALPFVNTNKDIMTVADLSNHLFAKLKPALTITPKHNGYIDTETGDIISNQHWRCSELFQVTHGSTLKIHSRTNTGLVLLAFYDQYGGYLKDVSPRSASSGSSYEDNDITVPAVAVYARFHSAYNSDVVATCTISGVSIPENSAKPIPTKDWYNHKTVLPVPLELSGKKIVFFGDSITYGVASCEPSEQYPYGLINPCDNPYAKLLCEKLGLDYTRATNNKAVSGSRFAGEVNDIESITDTITSFTDSADIIYIAGGTNDYATKVAIGSVTDTTQATLYGALNSICTFLKSNYPNAIVIFALPINWSKQLNYEVSIDAYRDAIYEVALSNGYYVVDGSEIGFPKAMSDSGYPQFKADVIYDGIHPTELGHVVMANSLARIFGGKSDSLVEYVEHGYDFVTALNQSTINTSAIWANTAINNVRIYKIKFVAQSGTVNFYKVTASNVSSGASITKELIASVTNSQAEQGTIKEIDVSVILGENDYLGINGSFRYQAGAGDNAFIVLTNTDTIDTVNANIVLGYAGVSIITLHDEVEDLQQKVEDIEETLNGETYTIGPDLMSVSLPQYIDNTEAIWCNIIPKLTGNALKITFKAYTGTTYFYKVTTNNIAVGATVEKQLIGSITNTASESGQLKSLIINEEFGTNDYLGINGAFYYATAGVSIDVYNIFYFDSTTNAILADSGAMIVGANVEVHSISMDERISNLENEIGGMLGIPENCVIVDKNGNGDYLNPFDAIVALKGKDTAVNPYTILVMPGVYNMPTLPKNKYFTYCENRYLAIVGTDKVNCILRNDNGYYNAGVSDPDNLGDNTPLKLSGNIYIANLTIISTDSENADNADPLYHTSYCIHFDAEAAEGSITEIHNCRLVNNHAPCIGFGIPKNVTLKVTDCELESDLWNPDNVYGGAIIYGHDRGGSTSVAEEHIVIKNCIFKSSNGHAFKSINNQNALMDCVFVGNACALPSGKGVSLGTETTVVSPSFGNSIPEMNVLT